MRIDVYSLPRFKFRISRSGLCMRIARQKIGGTVVEIYPLPAERSADHTTRLGFGIGDVDKTVASLKSTGCRVIKSPKQTKWGYMAVVAGPDGRLVELYSQRVPRCICLPYVFVPFLLKRLTEKTTAVTDFNHESTITNG